jgi:hypothetical protein
MNCQYGDDIKKSTILAKIYLEDGTTLVGRSFGSHKSVDGEVSFFLFQSYDGFKWCTNPLRYSRSSLQQEWLDIQRV